MHSCVCVCIFSLATANLNFLWDQYHICLPFLLSVCLEFNIRDKIVRTTTDSGSNFVKAFRVYGVTEDENNNAEPLGAEPDQSGECYTLVCDDDIAIVQCLGVLKSTLWMQLIFYYFIKQEKRTVKRTWLSPLKPVPCWSRMMGSNTSCQSSIGVPVTFWTWWVIDWVYGLSKNGNPRDDM